MIWTYTHLAAFAFGAFLAISAALAIAYYWDWRVSTAESDAEPPEAWWPVDGRVYVRCAIDGQLERVTGEEEDGDKLVLETKSIAENGSAEPTTTD